MASEAEVEAAAKIIERLLPRDLGRARQYASAVLEAAERVREEEFARKTDCDEATERVRKVRAKFG
jgi:hypothetical protein